MNKAIGTSAVMVILSLLLLASVGCASQKSVDDLTKQLADTNARLTKLEEAETRRHQDIDDQKTVAASNKASLDAAIQDADRTRLHCRVEAENDFNERLHLNGTPIPGKPGTYTADREFIQQNHAMQDKADAQCEKEYEDALQAARLRYAER